MTQCHATYVKRLKMESIGEAEAFLASLFPSASERIGLRAFDGLRSNTGGHAVVARSGPTGFTTAGDASHWASVLAFEREVAGLGLSPVVPQIIPTAAFTQANPQPIHTHTNTQTHKPSHTQTDTETDTYHPHAQTHGHRHRHTHHIHTTPTLTHRVTPTHTRHATRTHTMYQILWRLEAG